MNRSLFLHTCVLTLLAFSSVQADNWPQWRGPNNDGICTEKNLPTTWDASTNSNIAWKLPMPGMGGATPAVWGDRLFVTSEEGKQLVLLCISTDGKELWKRSLGTATPRARSDEGNGASASPSTDGKHVYVFVGNGTFAAFDFEGKEVWRFNAQQRYGKFNIQFGIHSTPVLHGNRLYVQLIHSGVKPRGSGWIVCLDKATGADVWKYLRKSDGYDENEHSYASCFMWSRGKDAYLVVHGNDYATAHRLEDGEEIWRLGDLNPKDDRYNRFLRFVASPVCTPDLIVVPSAKNGPVVAVKPEAKGAIGKGSPFEQWRIEKGTPDVPCPLVHNGLVYLCRENGELVCLDAASGKQHYRRATHNHRHRASPVYADGKLYLSSRDGVITVVAAGTEFNKLATNKLPDEIAASPAISGGKIFVRGFKYLWAIENPR